MSRVGNALRTLDVRARLVELVAAPTDGSAAAVFRVAFGLLAAVTTAGVAMNLARWFSNDGIMPSRVGNMTWSLFRFAPAASWMGPLHVGVLAAGTLMLLIGAWPRIGAFLIFLAHTSLQHRTPQILNSGDRLFAIVALLAVAMPLGHRWSVASWWRRRRGVAAPYASIWGLRLLQIQIAYVYANTAMAKAIVPRWRHGRALYDVLASPVFAEWPSYIDFAPVIYAMTWGTLVFEFGFPTLVWLRKAKPYVLLAGVGFHLMIDMLMLIPMFSWIMIVSYAAFLEDSWVRRAARRIGLSSPEPVVVVPQAPAAVSDTPRTLSTRAEQLH